MISLRQHTHTHTQTTATTNTKTETHTCRRRREERFITKTQMWTSCSTNRRDAMALFLRLVLENRRGASALHTYDSSYFGPNSRLRNRMQGRSNLLHHNNDKAFYTHVHTNMACYSHYVFFFLNGAGPLPERIFGPGSCR
jgi:hypothetical protein